MSPAYAPPFDGIAGRKRLIMAILVRCDAVSEALFDPGLKERKYWLANAIVSRDFHELRHLFKREFESDRQVFTTVTGLRLRRLENAHGSKMLREWCGYDDARMEFEAASQALAELAVKTTTAMWGQFDQLIAEGWTELRDKTDLDGKVQLLLFRPGDDQQFIVVSQLFPELSAGAISSAVRRYWPIRNRYLLAESAYKVNIDRTRSAARVKSGRRPRTSRTNWLALEASVLL